MQTNSSVMDFRVDDNLKEAFKDAQNHPTIFHLLIDSGGCACIWNVSTKKIHRKLSAPPKWREICDECENCQSIHLRNSIAFLAMADILGITVEQTDDDLEYLWKVQCDIEKKERDWNEI